MTKSSFRRDQSLDLVKIVAMVSVIGLHTTHDYINSSIFSFANIIYRSSVIAIPCFIMTSGYLLFGRSNCDYKYSIKKIWGIIKYVAIITIGWYCLITLLTGQTFSITTLFHDFIGSFIQKGPFYVFWYLGCMIIIYLCFPLLNKIYISNYYIFKVIVAVFFLIEYFVFQTNLLHDGEINIIQTFRIWNWIFYFCLGGLLRKLTFNIHSGIVILIAIVNLYYQHILTPYIGNTYCEFYYSSLPVILFSSAVFIYIKNHKIKEYNKVIGLVFDSFLPVYTFHMIILQICKSYFQIDSAILFVIVLLLTICVSIVIMRIPLSRKIFRI